MSHIIADRVKETSTTTGTGTFTLSGASTGAVTFNSVMADGDTCDYCIEGLNGDGTQSGQWEVGIGTYIDPDTLVRTTVVASSNSGSVVNFSAGTKNVFLTLRAGTVATLTTGTFTPTISGSSTAGTGTYNDQTGTYIKIGNMVFFRLAVSITAHTGTGNIIIGGLPYTCENNSTMAALKVENLTYTGQVAARIIANTTTVALETYATGATASAVAMDTTFNCIITGTYAVA